MTFQIITPGRFIEAKDPVNHSVGLEGWFTLSAIKNGDVVRSRRFKNLILNQGLDFLGNTNSSSFAHFHVGTGTATPTPTQVELTAKVGNSFPVNSSPSFNSDAPDYYSARMYTGLSAIGAFGTVNLTEIGYGLTNGKLFSRALIVDSVGNPVSFPINSDEQLQVTYELRVYPPLTDVKTTLNISGTREITSRSIKINDASYWGNGSYNNPAVFSAPRNSISGISGMWWLGGLNTLTSAAPQGSVLTSQGSVTGLAYTSGSYRRTSRWDWKSTEANGTLRTQGVGFAGAQFQVEYNPPIVKTADQTLFLNYELSWSRR